MAFHTNKFADFLLAIVFFLAIILLLNGGCSEKKDDNISPNIPPETKLFLQLGDPEVDMPDTTVSRQELFWYGNDPDGRVVGYYYHWDYFGDVNDAETWVWTVEESGVFYVPLQAEFGKFHFQVKAVDDQARFDGDPANDNSPVSTEGAVDPSPASIQIPIRNSAPEIDFVIGSNPYDDVSDTTFSTRSFFWTARDMDGGETITHFQWALDDTTAWNELPGNSRDLTIEEISEGLHHFYLRAVDVANAHSQVLVYPDSTGGETGSWYVKQIRGPLLFVDDDVTITNDPYFFENIFSQIPSLQNNNYSLWTVTERIPYYQGDIEATLNSFEAVVWNAYRTPNLPKAAPALSSFINSGGKLFLSSSWAYDQGDTLLSFLPVDSLNWVDIERIMPETEIQNLVDGYPPIITGSNVISLADSPEPSAGAESIYLLPASDNPGGNPVDLPFGVRFPAGGPATLVYFPAPLPLCSNGGDQFLLIVLQLEFGL
ncbi:MAG: hypothetical protein B6244_01505 [Candidatus Cloacimonetes bacterium 4572_55]|nr:MAG: hypothetical protein B6244_01505 [Candidatus Cloacimonetes bacterium 4572_55]